MACPNLSLAFYVTISCLLGTAIGQTGAACSADLQCENLQQLVTVSVKGTQHAAQIFLNELMVEIYSKSLVSTICKVFLMTFSQNTN